MISEGIAFVTTESGDAVSTKEKAQQEKLLKLHFQDGKLEVVPIQNNLSDN